MFPMRGYMLLSQVSVGLSVTFMAHSCVDAANPFITTKGVADKLAIAFTTAQRATERLERARIVKRVGAAKRDRVYCATALLDILEEPARLKPADNK
jgi:hypothetical protein